MKNDDTHTTSKMIEDTKRSFDESVDGLDAATLSKLNRSRQAALAELAGPNKAWMRWMPATGLAAAVTLAVVMVGNPLGPDETSAATADYEILLGEESIEMFEDLEFYSWLATQELEGDSDLG